VDGAKVISDSRGSGKEGRQKRGESKEGDEDLLEKTNSRGVRSKKKRTKTRVFQETARGRGKPKARRKKSKV